MDLTKYIDHGESIEMYFGTGIRYFGIIVIFWSLLFGGLIYFFADNLFFVQPLLVMWGLVITYQVIVFFTTHYFVTEKKIYKKIGFLWSKVISVKLSEVDDMQVVQGIFERFIYGTGTIKVNTPGSPGFEMVLKRIAGPYDRKKKISAIIS